MINRIRTFCAKEHTRYVEEKIPKSGDRITTTVAVATALAGLALVGAGGMAVTAKIANGVEDWANRHEGEFHSPPAEKPEVTPGTSN